MLLYNWLSAIYCTPGPDSSILISTEKAVPNKPENSAKIKYNIPMSFALHDKNQRSHHMDILAPFKLPGFSVNKRALCSRFISEDEFTPFKPSSVKTGASCPEFIYVNAFTPFKQSFVLVDNRALRTPYLNLDRFKSVTLKSPVYGIVWLKTLSGKTRINRRIRIVNYIPKKEKAK